MKITNLKAIVAKSLIVGLLAGAFALAVPAKADAQVVVQVGYPHYVYGPDYYARLRFDEPRRHAEWVRAREFRPYRYGYRGR